MRESTTLSRLDQAKETAKELAEKALATAERLFPNEGTVSTYVAGQMLALAAAAMIAAACDLGVDGQWAMARIQETLQMGLSPEGRRLDA